MSEERGYIGQVVRVTLDFIEQRGLTARVREKVSPETARLMAKPPFPFGWLPPAPMDELETLVGEFGGREASVELGLHAARKIGGTMMEPIIRTALTFFGSSPATIFAHLDRIYPAAVRGWHFEYQALSGKSGVITARSEGPGVPAAIFDVMRGNLSWPFEVCSVSGETDAPEVVRHDASGAELRFNVRWE